MVFPPLTVTKEFTDCVKVVVSTGKGDWGNLAQGTSLLLSSRGVQGYSSEFEYAMLESQMPYVVSLSFSIS